MLHRFFDNTLRDGEQMPGLVFNTKSKIAIVKALNEIGVSAAEVGCPAVSDEERNSIKCIVDLCLPIDVVGLCRPIKKDVDYARDCGLKSVRVLLPRSKHIVQQLGIEFNKLKINVAKIIEYAVNHNLSVRFVYEDAARAMQEEIIDCFNLAINAGATTVCFADTAGIMLPLNMFQRIREIKQEISIDLAVHCHNDLGLATANTIAAAQAGAVELECCVNGIGERAGNAAFEEVVIILEQCLKVSTSINLKLINDLSRLVSQKSRHMPSSNKPIVGEKVFQHESGIHANSIISGERIYEAFPPELIGRKHEIMLGKHSSLKSLEFILEKENIMLTKEQQKDLLVYIKSVAEQEGDVNSIIVNLKKELNVNLYSCSS